MTPAPIPNHDLKPQEKLDPEITIEEIHIPDNLASKNEFKIEEEVSIIEVPGTKKDMSSDLSDIQIITSNNNNTNNNNSKSDGKRSPNGTSRGRKPKSKLMENQNTPEKESR